MDFKQLETFVAVAKLKSFSRAADHLYLTQPTISNHIQNLEWELGTVLINRDSKNVTLTRAGEILFQYALDIINKRDKALFSLGKFKGKIEGVLEISASTIPEQYFLPSVLCQFNKQYPHVQFNIMKYGSQVVIDKILSGEIDFGIVGFKKDLKKLNYIEIMDDRIILVAPNQGKYKEMEKIDLPALRDEVLIMREKGSGTRKVVEEALLKHNLTIDSLNILAFIENTQTIKECVKRGCGLTFISQWAVVEEIEKGLLKKIDMVGLEIKRKFYFVYHNQRELSPLAETFRQFVVNSKISSENR